MKPRLDFFLFFMLTSQIVAGQSKVVMVEFYHNHLYQGLDNVMFITAQQENPVDISQVFAYHWHYNQPSIPIEISGADGVFKIRVDTFKTIQVAVVVRGDTIVNSVKVMPITPWLYLGGFRLGQNETMSVEDMKSQSGLAARIMNLDIDARCRVLGYELIRITKAGHVFRVFNLGGQFSKESLEIVKKVESGDLFIFRKIKYRCPSGRVQNMDDVSFEVK